MNEGFFQRLDVVKKLTEASADSTLLVHHLKNEIVTDYECFYRLRANAEYHLMRLQSDISRGKYDDDEDRLLIAERDIKVREAKVSLNSHILDALQKYLDLIPDVEPPTTKREPKNHDFLKSLSFDYEE